MAEVLFKARNQSGKLRCSQIGDLCLVGDNGHTWGTKEALPRFVRVICTSFTKAQLLPYREKWFDNFDYTVLNANPNNATYEVRVFNTTDNASHDIPITLSKVENYLTSWGCTGIAVNEPRSVDFTVSLWNMVRSDGFWSRENIDDFISFTLQNYDSGTGVGRILAVTPDGWQNNHSIVIDKIEERGGTIVSAVYPNYIFDIERSDILSSFKADVKRRLEQLYRKYRYYIEPSVVAYIVSQGGTITVNETQFWNYLKDKLND
jgi:hypothetical protein